MYFGATGLPTAAITDAQLLATEGAGVTVLGHGGHLDKTDGLIHPVGLAITVDRTIGSNDTIYGIGGEDVLIGGSAGDDGSTAARADDLIFGDQVLLDCTRDLGNSDPRFQDRAGTRSTHRATPTARRTRCSTARRSSTRPGGHARLGLTQDHRPSSATRRRSGDTSATTTSPAAPANDMIFGQLGNDTIQGDGSIDYGDAPGRGTSRVGAGAPADASGDASGSRLVDPSVDSVATDGNDYIEGGGGNDVIFGNQGQDDLIGGSSTSSASTTARPSGPDGTRHHLRRLRHRRPAATTRATLGASGTRATPT